jgi:plastocyanin
MFISSDFQSGEYYNYFCSIHPTMRGVFKVVD